MEARGATASHLKLVIIQLMKHSNAIIKYLDVAFNLKCIFSLFLLKLTNMMNYRVAVLLKRCEMRDIYTS